MCQGAGTTRHSQFHMLKAELTRHRCPTTHPPARTYLLRAHPLWRRAALMRKGNKHGRLRGERGRRRAIIWCWRVCGNRVPVTIACLLLAAMSDLPCSRVIRVIFDEMFS